MEIEAKIQQAAQEFAETVSSTSEDFILRGATLQMAIRDVVWALYGENKDHKDTIIDMLDIMHTALEDEKEEKEPSVA